MGDNYRFAESDSLLCYHGPMLYEAKCLKRRKANDGKAQYFIHYKGWNSKWEEWVDDNRVLAVNNANMNKMASLKEIHSNTKKSGVKRSITVVKEETIRNIVTPPTKGKKRKYSEISTELNQTVNVQSPMESKPKKRGRPPKIKEIEATKSIDTTESTKSVDTIEGSKSLDTTEATKSIDTTEATKSIDTTEATKSLDTTEATKSLDTTEATKSLDTTEATKSLDTTETETAESMEENKVTEKPIEESKEIKEIEEENTTKQDEVIKANDEATEKNETIKKVSDTKKVEGVECVKATTVIESTQEEAKTKTVDEKIKPIEEVDKSTEELEEIKAVESCERSKDIEDTVTINVGVKSETVEGSETVERTDTVERTEDIEETVTAEGFEAIRDSEDVELEDNELEGVELEGNELEGDELEGEELEGEDLDGEEPEIEDLEACEETEEYDTNDEIDTEIETEEDSETYEESETDEKSETEEESEGDGLKRYDRIVPYELKNVILKTRTDEDVIFTAPAPVVKLNIPPNIRRRIAYDSFQIVKNNKLLKFPKTITVEHLVQAFMNSNDNYLAKRDNIDIGRTMIQYFNSIIHEKLLYSPENAYKMQKKAVDCLKTKIYNDEDISFNNTLHPRQLWHVVYGPTYLLRLFLQLPYFASKYVYPEKCVSHLVQQFESFMTYIENNFDKFFSNDEYVEADDKEERMDCEFYKNLMTLLNNKQNYQQIIGK